MQRLLLIITLLVCAVYLYAQPRYGKYNYYSAGARFTYDMYNYSELSGRNVDIRVRPAFSLGASAGYYASYLIELHGGYRVSWHKVDMDWILPDNPHSNAVDYSKYNLTYISVPLQARINVIYLRQFKLNIGAGLMPEYRIRQSETVTYANGLEFDTEDIHTTKEFRKWLVATPLSMHMKFNLNRHFAIELGGYFNYYLNRMIPNYMNKNGYTYSVSLGFYWDWG